MKEQLKQFWLLAYVRTHPPFLPINPLVEKWRLVTESVLFSSLQRQNLILLCNERSVLSSVVNLQRITFLGDIISLKQLAVFVKRRVRDETEAVTGSAYLHALQPVVHTGIFKGGGSGVESLPFLYHAPFDFVDFRESNTLWVQSEILTPNRMCKIIEIHLSEVEAPYYNPSRSPIARSALRLLSSPIPGGFYADY
ncbi:uncharacterized protein TNCV_1779351 [Trichonephila clavipes]|nr:uncharacterized protein TNCV_1779351 [Trichonephila clavipes]